MLTLDVVFILSLEFGHVLNLFILVLTLSIFFLLQYNQSFLLHNLLASYKFIMKRRSIDVKNLINFVSSTTALVWIDLI